MFGGRSLEVESSDVWKLGCSEFKVWRFGSLEVYLQHARPAMGRRIKIYVCYDYYYYIMFINITITIIMIMLIIISIRRPIAGRAC